ncbi:hypothetical protein FB451DRAFT_1173057 [Mycena latifolia]|nr:hypothetical protein FB451DRAFT_1173057 [Mycena latifolia]
MVIAAVAEEKYAQCVTEISALKEADRRDRVAGQDNERFIEGFQKYIEEYDRLRAEMAALKDAHQQLVTQLQNECDSLGFEGPYWTKWLFVQCTGPFSGDLARSFI